MQNTSYLDYRMPVSTGLPMIDTQLVEAPDPAHPTGVRRVGSVSTIPPVPGAVLETLWEMGSV